MTLAINTSSVTNNEEFRINLRYFEEIKRLGKLVDFRRFLTYFRISLTGNARKLSKCLPRFTPKWTISTGDCWQRKLKDNTWNSTISSRKPRLVSATWNFCSNNWRTETCCATKDGPKWSLALRRDLSGDSYSRVWFRVKYWPLADLGGAWGTHTPPWASKFFRFHAVFGKIWRVHAPPGGFTPPLGKILDPPLLTTSHDWVIVMMSIISFN